MNDRIETLITSLCQVNTQQSYVTHNNVTLEDKVTFDLLTMIRV